MIATIETIANRVYWAPMRIAALRLLTLFALLLMPFGMAAASSAPVAGHHSSAMPTEHCDDQPGEKQSGGAVAKCAMPCAAALPAADLAPADQQPVPRARSRPPIEPRLAGILMEIATPPPKLD